MSSAETRKRCSEDVYRATVENTGQDLHAEKLAAVGRFMSTVAHELNNPLTVIVGFSEILLANLKMNEQDHADLQMVASEANRARLMIHELLELSREQPAQMEPVDLNRLILSTLDHLREDPATSQIDVTMDLAADAPFILGDPERLSAAFMSLVNYMRRSRPAVSERCPLSVATTVGQTSTPGELSRVARITFADDSPHPSPVELSQAFEPRYTRRETDHGLGMALAFNLIHQHNGRISALSGPGGGAQFTIELPLRASESGN
jgi:two-component system, NtrC family, sensor kinase